jgi:hypothetical protein
LDENVAIQLVHKGTKEGSWAFRLGPGRELSRVKGPQLPLPYLGGSRWQKRGKMQEVWKDGERKEKKKKESGKWDHLGWMLS